MIKATYETGSSIMMNIGRAPVLSKCGLVTSLAWRMNGSTDYVLEGNVNNAGFVITWLKDNLGIIHSPEETQELAALANVDDKAYFVPAFTGFGAPYWDPLACAVIYGMRRTTGKKEIAKAALECIAYQIADVVFAMEKDTGIELAKIRADGSPVKNSYLMQFQSDIINMAVQIPKAAELSGLGAAYAAGISLGIYQQNNLFNTPYQLEYQPKMEYSVRRIKYIGWQNAVRHSLSRQ